MERFSSQADTPVQGIFPMTGPRAYTLADTARVVAELTGHPCRYEQETLEQARETRKPLASEPWEVDVWVGSYQAIAAGEVSSVTNDLAVARTTRERFGGVLVGEDKPAFLNLVLSSMIALLAAEFYYSEVA